MSQSARAMIIELGRELSDQNDKSFNLWTWLPSYKAAKAAHGDYADEFKPSIGDIMTEAAMYISHGLKPTPEQIAEAGEFYRCPCGEDHASKSESQAG